MGLCVNKKYAPDVTHTIFQTVSEGKFSETHIPDLVTLCNRTGGKPISSLGPGPMEYAT